MRSTSLTSSDSRSTAGPPQGKRIKNLLHFQHFFSDNGMSIGFSVSSIIRFVIAM
jgi:hypothetical protein